MISRKVRCASVAFCNASKIFFSATNDNDNEIGPMANGHANTNLNGEGWPYKT